MSSSIWEDISFQLQAPKKEIRRKQRKGSDQISRFHSAYIEYVWRLNLRRTRWSKAVSIAIKTALPMILMLAQNSITQFVLWTVWQKTCRRSYKNTQIPHSPFTCTHLDNITSLWSSELHLHPSLASMEVKLFVNFPNSKWKISNKSRADAFLFHTQEHASEQAQWDRASCIPAFNQQHVLLTKQICFAGCWLLVVAGSLARMLSYFLALSSFNVCVCRRKHIMQRKRRGSKECINIL